MSQRIGAFNIWIENKWEISDIYIPLKCPPKKAVYVYSSTNSVPVRVPILFHWMILSKISDALLLATWYGEQKSVSLGMGRSEKTLETVSLWLVTENLGTLVLLKMTSTAVLDQKMWSFMAYRIRVLILFQPTLCAHTKYVWKGKGRGGRGSENGSFREGTFWEYKKYHGMLVMHVINSTALRVLLQSYFQITYDYMIRETS